MAEYLSDKLREYLRTAQGRVVNLKDLRLELKIDPASPAWESLGREMRRLVLEKIVRPSGNNDGFYKVIKQVKAVRVFDKSRERRSPFELIFPKDFDTGMEIPVAEDIVIREGDLIEIGGVSNYGKTTKAMNFIEMWEEADRADAGVDSIPEEEYSDYVGGCLIAMSDEFKKPNPTKGGSLMIEEVKKILNSEPVKMYPSIEDAKRAILQRNEELAKQICQLIEEAKREERERIRALFLKYLTVDSKTQDARRKEFNQAIFIDPKDKIFGGRQVFNGTDLDMVMEKFDKALKEK